MTTDTALGVTKRVVVDRGSFPKASLLITQPGSLVLARTVPLEDIPYVVRGATC